MAEETTQDGNQAAAFDRIRGERDQLRTDLDTATKALRDTAARERVFTAVAHRVGDDVPASRVDRLTTTFLPHLVEYEGEELTNQLNSQFDFLLENVSPPAPVDNDAPVPAADLGDNGNSSPGFAPSPAGEGEAVTGPTYDRNSPEWRQAAADNNEAWFDENQKAGRLKWLTDGLPASRG